MFSIWLMNYAFLFSSANFISSYIRCFFITASYALLSSLLVLKLLFVFPSSELRDSFCMAMLFWSMELLRFLSNFNSPAMKSYSSFKNTASSIVDGVVLAIFPSKKSVCLSAFSFRYF